MEQSQGAEKNNPVKRARNEHRRDKTSQSDKPATIDNIGAKDTAAGVGQSQTTLITEAKQVEKRSLKNDAAGGKTAVVKRARIDHADTAISSDKKATTKPLTVGYQTFKGLGPHRTLAVQAEDRKMVLDENNRAKQDLHEKEIKEKAAEGRARALKVFAEMQMSLENDADGGKTAVLKRARIDHADTAISSDKNATTEPSIVGHPAAPDATSRLAGV
jgi:hypothetical protein